MDDIGYPNIIIWFNNMMDNDGPLTDRDSLDKREKLLAMFSSRGPNATAEEHNTPIARDKVALRVENYIMAAGFGEECKKRGCYIPRTLSEVPHELRPHIASWVSDLINALVTYHQPENAVSRRAVDEAVGQMSIKLRDPNGRS